MKFIQSIDLQQDEYNAKIAIISETKEKNDFYFR